MSRPAVLFVCPRAGFGPRLRRRNPDLNCVAVQATAPGRRWEFVLTRRRSFPRLAPVAPSDELRLPGIRAARALAPSLDRNHGSSRCSASAASLRRVRASSRLALVGGRRTRPFLRLAFDKRQMGLRRLGTKSSQTCMGLFLSSSHFWLVGDSLFGAGMPFFVPSPAIRFAERAEGVTLFNYQFY